MPLPYFPFATSQVGGRPPQIIAFPDASFGTLRTSGPVESYCDISGIPIRRRGAILCKGNIISFYGSKISRVARSTSHADGIAPSNVSGSALFLQCLFGELISGSFPTSFLRAYDDSDPLLTPFRHPILNDMPSSSPNDIYSDGSESSYYAAFWWKCYLEGFL